MVRERKGKGQESSTFNAANNGCVRCYRTNPSVVNVEVNVYSASTHGVKHDNPCYIKLISELQEARSVFFRHGGVCEFSAIVAVGAGQGARMSHFFWNIIRVLPSRAAPRPTRNIQKEFALRETCDAWDTEGKRGQG